MSLRTTTRGSLTAIAMVLLITAAAAATPATEVQITTNLDLQEETTMSVSRANEQSIEAGWTDQRSNWPGVVNCGLGLVQVSQECTVAVVEALFFVVGD